mgnify:CR=1 FL=1
MKGGGHWLDLLKTSGAKVLGIDWTISLKDAKLAVNNSVSLQGNLDPSILLAPDDVIRKEVCKVLESYGQGNGHIFNSNFSITDHGKIDVNFSRRNIENNEIAIQI